MVNWFYRTETKTRLESKMLFQGGKQQHAFGMLVSSSHRSPSRVKLAEIINSPTQTGSNQNLLVFPKKIDFRFSLPVTKKMRLASAVRTVYNLICLNSTVSELYGILKKRVFTKRCIFHKNRIISKTTENLTWKLNH